MLSNALVAIMPVVICVGLAVMMIMDARKPTAGSGRGM